jgi:hypothetical protein
MERALALEYAAAFGDDALSPHAPLSRQAATGPREPGE